MIGSRDQHSIAHVLTMFQRDNDALIDSLIQLQYYMRGAISRDDLWAMTPIERERYFDFLNKRFKEVNEMLKHQIPVLY